ncbi:macrocin-O-methyltransferase domain protein [Leptolyngbya sp. NIES-3755]|nr:macrocin-O-methyltransferase domain protein [Leptolyngbya sp. NIES-3755]
MTYAINTLRKVIHLTGLRKPRHEQQSPFPPDFDEEAIEIIQAVQPYTMTSIERIFSLIHAVRYVVQHNIKGDIVECGVWKGGSMLAIAKTLAQLNDYSRDLYLFDTFEGMTPPTEKDVIYNGEVASTLLENSTKTDENSIWCYAPLESVKATLNTAQYDSEKLHFIQGSVEETLPEQAPATISILRLDTDWYESTRHELVHLFPRVSVGGVIIIDDYGYWQGSRLATDEYLKQNNIKLFLSRIDDSGRIGIKLPSHSD